MKKKYLLLIILITLFMGMGYAKINNVNLTITGKAKAKDKGTIGITNVILTDQSNNFTSIADPPTFTQSEINFSMSLYIDKQTDAQEEYYAVYKVTVSNTSFNDYTIASDLFTPVIQPTYPAGSSLDPSYTISGLNPGDVIQSNTSVEFTITITLDPGTKKGTYGINITTNVEPQEEDNGLLIGNIPSTNTVGDLTGSNTIAAFTAEVMNTYSTQKTFNFTLNKDNFTMVDSNGNTPSNFTIAANTTQNYTFYVKRNSGALFLKTPQTMNIYLYDVDEDASSGIGTVSVDVDVAQNWVDNEDPVINSLNVTRQKDSRSLVVTWSASDNTGVDEYVVSLYDNSNQTTSTQTQTLAGDVTTYTFTDVADGTYFVRLTAYDQNDNNATSNTTATEYIWTYTITINCTYCSGNPSSGSVDPNGSFTTTLSGTGNYTTPASANVGVEMVGTSNPAYSYNATSGVFSINNITGNVTITAAGTDSSGDTPCLIKGTKVLLADGTTKNVEDIGYDDLLLVYSHETGEFVPEYPIWIESGKPTTHYQLTTFSDNTTLKTIGAHTVFGVKDNEFIDVADRNKFNIGTEILKVEKINNKYQFKKVTVTNIETIYENTYYYDVVSTRYYNAITDNVLTSDGRPALPNFYKFKENVLWSDRRIEVLENNIQTPYEKLSYIPYYLFKGLRATDQAVLEHYGYIDANGFRQLFETLLLNPYMIQEPPTNKKGNRIWMVTTSLDEVIDKTNYLHEEGSYYTLPKTSGKWYSPSENVYYNGEDIIQVWHGMHFIEVK